MVFRPDFAVRVLKASVPLEQQGEPDLPDAAQRLRAIWEPGSEPSSRRNQQYFRENCARRAENVMIFASQGEFCSKTHENFS